MRRPLILALTILIAAACAHGLEVTLYDIQYTTDPDGASSFDDSTVTTGGIVTGIAYQGAASRYFLSDRGGGLWHGIYVSENQSRTLTLGDSVHFQAEVQESSTQTRLRNIVSSSFERFPAVAPVVSLVTTTGSIGEAAEGVLVELRNAVVTSISGNNFIVDDGSGPVTISDGWEYLFTPFVGDTLLFVRGLVTSLAGQFTVNPRDDFDFGFHGNRPPVITSVSFSPEMPSALESDTVRAVVIDDSLTASVTIYYRFAPYGDTGSDYLTQPMYDDGTHGDALSGDNVWTGVIPTGPSRMFASFYVRATDNQNTSSVSPANAPAAVYSYLIRSETFSVFDAQYTGDPTGGQSAYVNTIQTMTGIVTAAGFDGRNTFFISDPGGGQWSGLMCYNPPTAASVGDCVRVTGTILEFPVGGPGLTELSPTTRVDLLGRGNVPAPIAVQLGIMADSAEAYEGAFVRTEGNCIVTDVSQLQEYGQFKVRDATGEGVILTDFGLEYEPAIGDTITFIQGCVSYHSSPKWMIAPRSDADLGVIDHRAPALRNTSSVGEREINVVFSEVLLPEGLDDIANYRVVDQTDPSFPELHVASAYLFSTARTIHIEVMEALIDSHGYRLEITRVTDLAGNALENAASSFGGYDATPCASIDSIYLDFARYDAQPVALRGVVTFVQDVTTTSGSRRISAFMQDASGAGMSLSNTGAASLYPGIQRGNMIEIRGTITAYQGVIQMGEFAATSMSVIAENVPLPAPVVVATGDRRLQRQIVHTSSQDNYSSGTWVQTTGTLRTVDENVGGGTNIQIDDGSGNLIVRLWDSMNVDSVYLANRWYRLRELPGKRLTLLGPSSTYNGDFQMLIGYAEDFQVPADELGMGLAETLNLSFGDATQAFENRPFAPDLGQTLKIRVEAPAASEVRLRVFDLRGHLVNTLFDNAAGGSVVIEWDGRDDLNNLLPIGTYLLHLECVRDGKTDSKMKPVVIGTRL